MASIKNFELHKSVCVKHVMIVGNVTMVDEQVVTIVTNLKDPQIPARTITIHRRQIGDKTIEVSVDNGAKEQASDLTNKELAEMEAQWKQFWRPTITEEQIHTAINTSETDYDPTEEIQVQDEIA